MADTAILTVRLPAEIEARLERLAQTTSVSKSDLAADAIAAYLDEQERQLEKIREGLADAEAGRVVSHKEVARWLDSWGTENELPPPKCGYDHSSMGRYAAASCATNRLSGFLTHRRAW